MKDEKGTSDKSQAALSLPKPRESYPIA